MKHSSVAWPPYRTGVLSNCLLSAILIRLIKRIERNERQWRITNYSALGRARVAADYCGCTDCGYDTREDALRWAWRLRQVVRALDDPKTLAIAL